jgi:hypothetical protein
MNNLSCDLGALHAIIIMGSKASNVHGSSLATIGFQAIKWTNAISWINFMNFLYPIYFQIWLNYHPMDDHHFKSITKLGKK